MNKKNEMSEHTLRVAAALEGLVSRAHAGGDFAFHLDALKDSVVKLKAFAGANQALAQTGATPFYVPVKISDILGPLGRDTFIEDEDKPKDGCGRPGCPFEKGRP